MYLVHAGSGIKPACATGMTCVYVNTATCDEVDRLRNNFRTIPHAGLIDQTAITWNRNACFRKLMFVSSIFLWKCRIIRRTTRWSTIKCDDEEEDEKSQKPSDIVNFLIVSFINSWLCDFVSPALGPIILATTGPINMLRVISYNWYYRMEDGGYPT